MWEDLNHGNRQTLLLSQYWLSFWRTSEDVLQEGAQESEMELSLFKTIFCSQKNLMK